MSTPSSARTEPALWSQDGSRLAVVSAEEHVVVVPVAGGEAKRVTTGSGFEQETGWFADGDRLAYVMTRGEGGGSVTSFASSLATGAAEPLVPSEKRFYIGTPSPDGKHIGFGVIESNRPIWVADRAGKNPRQLTQ